MITNFDCEKRFARWADGRALYRRRGEAGGKTAVTRKQRRLVLIGSGLGVLAVAVTLMLDAFRDSIVFFNSPSDVAGAAR
jgi:hypothetical protein